MYFNTYQGTTPPAGVRIQYSLMDRKETVPLDNKSLLAKRLIKYNLCDPMVYFDPHDVPLGDRLWYLKDPLATAGKAMQVLTRHDIDKFFQTGNIIQEAITDVCLINRRKFTLRIYVLVYYNKIFLYPDGIIVTHGVDYDPNSTDYSMQVDHRGYRDPNSSVQMRPFSTYHKYLTFMIEISKSAPNIFQLFADTLSDSEYRYCLFGVDYLCKNNGHVALIEVNDRPNLFHTKEINQKINIEMIRDLVVLVTNNILHNSIEYPQRFMEIGSL